MTFSEKCNAISKALGSDWTMLRCEGEEQLWDNREGGCYFIFRSYTDEEAEMAVVFGDDDYEVDFRELSATHKNTMSIIEAIERGDTSTAQGFDNGDMDLLSWAPAFGETIDQLLEDEGALLSILNS